MAPAALLAWLFLSPSVGQGNGIAGRVVDAVTHEPISGAIVTVDRSLVETDKSGSFRIESLDTSVSARAYGYWRNRLPAADSDPLEIELQPISPHAVHLPLSGIEDAGLRESLIGLHAVSEINSLVIEVKDAHGLVAVPQPGIEEEPQEAAGATANDLALLVQELHRDGMYAIARIAVFKDDALANRHLELALKAADGDPVHEVDGMAWVDPASRSVWDYNIAIRCRSGAARLR